MNEEMYLLDNNALSHLTRAQRASTFFHDRCHLPSEIIHEAEGCPDAASFRDVEYPTTANVLKHLTAVMATLPADDIKLVNLYANKRAADPLLIACALDGMEGCGADAPLCLSSPARARPAIRRAEVPEDLRQANVAECWRRSV